MSQQASEYTIRDCSRALMTVMEQYEIEFVANNPGVWLFHCHNLEHMSGGLMAEVHYR